VITGFAQVSRHSGRLIKKSARLLEGDPGNSDEDEQNGQDNDYNDPGDAQNSNTRNGGAGDPPILPPIPPAPEANIPVNAASPERGQEMMDTSNLEDEVEEVMNVS
jgi:hypothetical protein